MCPGKKKVKGKFFHQETANLSSMQYVLRVKNKIVKDNYTNFISIFQGIHLKTEEVLRPKRCVVT